MNVKENIEDLERQAVEFALAARLVASPSSSLAHDVEALEPHLSGQVPALAAVRAHLAEHGLAALQSEHFRLFGSHAQRVSLHETEYGRMRGMAKGHDLADISGFYQAFGLEVTHTATDRDLPDHLSCELEFYGVLLARSATLLDQADEEGVFVVRDARRKFLSDHLGRLAITVASNALVEQHPTFGPVLAWAADLVANECRALDASPAPLDFFEGAAEPDEVCCAVTPKTN